jgi:V/A-type H+-transporting ATPase subunit C
MSEFRPPLSSRPADIPACEARLLEQYYTRLLERVRARYGGVTLENLEKLIYYQIDVHNVSVIFRMKRYFKAAQAEISRYLVRVRTRLSAKALDELLAAATDGALPDILKKHRLEKTFPIKPEYTGEQLLAELSRERLRLCRDIFSLSFSPAVSAVSYMALLEIEARNIINIIEGARYGLGAGQVRALLAL